MNLYDLLQDNASLNVTINAGQLIEVVNYAVTKTKAEFEVEQPQLTAHDTRTDYITRKEVAERFKISLVTVHDWTKKKVLTAYKIGNKVFYKRCEVEQALIKKGA